MLRRETVRHLWIPVVHVRGKIIEQQQRGPSARPKAPVGKPNIPSLDELRGSGLVRDVGHWRILRHDFFHSKSVAQVAATCLVSEQAPNYRLLFLVKTPRASG